MEYRQNGVAGFEIDRWILIGQISVYFGLIILTLRHFYLIPANAYGVLAAAMLIGFLPSLSYKLAPHRFTPYILVANALALVSIVFSLIGEWAIAGAFLLVPVFSLLFQDLKLYLLTSFVSLGLCLTLLVLFALGNDGGMEQQMIILLDMMTVFVIVVFITYFVVRDLRRRNLEEARHLHSILSLSQSVEAKDPYTRGHSERVAQIAQIIASDLGLTDAQTVYHAGLIHDVGKLSIPDAILLKKDRLSEDEYRTMKDHTLIGAKLCKNLNLSEDMVNGVLCHHERWDGKGYPNGLVGEAIPLIGRILGIADAIDAMSSDRSYRKALEPSAIWAEVERNAGRQFDPRMVDLARVRRREIMRLYE